MKPSLKKKYRLFSEAAITGVTQVACIFASVISIKVITSYIAPDEYGAFSLILTIVSFINILFFSVISNGLGRFYSVASEKNDLGNYFIAGIYILNKSIGGVFILAFAAACAFWFRGNYSKAVFAFVMALYCVTNVLNSIVAGLLNAARQRTLAGILMGMDLWLRIAFVWIMLGYYETSYKSVMYGYCMSSAFVLLLNSAASRKLIKSKTEKSLESIMLWRNEILRYGRPFLVFSLLAWMQQQSGRWSLEYFCNTAQVGQFSVLLQIGSAPIQAFTGSLMMFLSPILFSKAGDAKDDDRRNNVVSITHKLAAIGLIATLCLFLASIAFNKEIFTIITSNNYLLVSNLLPLVVISSGLNSIATVYHIRYCSLLAAEALLPITAISAMISSLSTIALTQRYNLYGASVSLLVYPIIYLALLAFYSYRKV